MIADYKMEEFKFKITGMTVRWNDEVYPLVGMEEEEKKYADEDNALAKGLNVNDGGTDEIEFCKRVIALHLKRYNILKNGGGESFTPKGCEEIAMRSHRYNIEQVYEPRLVALGAIFIKTDFGKDR